MTEPAPNATATAEVVVSESDCAHALGPSDAPLDNFPSVFATTRMIALMELADAERRRA